MEKNKNTGSGQDNTGRQPDHQKNRPQWNEKGARNESTETGSDKNDKSSENTFDFDQNSNFNDADKYNTNEGHSADRLKERDRAIAENLPFDNITDRQEQLTDRHYKSITPDLQSKTNPPVVERNFGEGEKTGNEDSDKDNKTTGNDDSPLTGNKKGKDPKDRNL